MRSTQRIVLAAAFTLALPTVSIAQTENRLAVGAALAGRTGGRSDATGDVHPSFLWRIGHGAPGWGFRYGFNWYRTNLSRSSGGPAEPFGTLNVRPLLVGYGYRFALGNRTSLSANLKGGYAFSSFSLQPAFGDHYRSALGVQDVSVDAANTFVLKPELSAWVDLSRKIGVSINAGYMIAKPRVALLSPAGADQRRVDADMFMLKIGAVYSIF